MDRGRERRLIELAVERGYLREEEARKVVVKPPAGRTAGEPLEEVWGVRLASLIRSGHIDRRRLVELLGELDASDLTEVEIPWRERPDHRVPGGENRPVAGAVDWAVQTAVDEGASVEGAMGGEELAFLDGWERYRIVSFIGAGGMGQVYKALDPSLGRHAALKFLRWNEPLQLERFLHEARAQARVEHDNVCKVYEAGRVAGRPYIAMQLVEGETLGDAGDLLTLEQKVKVVRDVARAIHAAHRLGLTHRDLKPGNILLERRDDGSWHPFVVDFGLAQDQDAGGLTRTGSVTGTPAYLSPEQARGEAVDRRSDLYSLGVVLYELLAGEVPLRGKSLAESLVKVVTEEPMPLRRLDPKVPRDLETIVMKCLEKEPQRRYDSARALADDLDRYLDGEPIEARRSSLAYRTGKWVLRNRALAGVLAGASVLLLALAGWSLYAQWRTEQEARLLQRFSQEVSRVESQMRLAALLPRHDITPEKRRLRATMGYIRGEMERLGEVAAGPGHYALGRGALAQHDYGGALENLERAWQLGEDRPEVAAGLGRALGVLYQRALLVLSEPRQDSGGTEPLDSGREALERRYRKPALAYLEEARKANSPYVEAMIAFYRERYAEATAHARRAYEAEPWFYEARQLEAEILVEQADRAQTRGRHQEALAFFADAGAIYAELLDIARSDATLYAMECARRLQVLTLEAEIGTLEEARFPDTLAHCDLALTVDRELAQAYTEKANLYWLWANQLDARGEDPRAKLEEAARFAEQALELDGREVIAYHHRGIAYRRLAEQAVDRGDDPEAYIELAIDSLERSLEIQPYAVDNLTGLGNVYVIKAGIEDERGDDPFAAFERAIERYRQALALDPDGIGPLNNLGMVWLERAETEIDRGLDPTGSLAAAVEHLGEALELNPRNGSVLNNMGTVYLTRADYQMRRGEDARAALGEAIAFFRRTAEVMPRQTALLYNIGMGHRFLAEQALSRGEDAAADLAAARRAYFTALEIRPEPDLYLELARLERLVARRAMAAGADPASATRAAAAALQRGLEMNPNAAELHQERAALARLEAAWAQGRGEPAGAAIGRGLEAAGRALELNAELVEARALEGSLCRLAAEEAGLAGERGRLLAQAVAALGEALERDPRLRREYGDDLAAAQRLAADG